ncbi:CutC family protein [Fibrisoma limi BUZ 3]|uniref:PF03932 family protein CutC n=1 Tax=Fibrisoma limi BUZ 3 TaxID=1185876 RepID=I2GQZ1_9BACT|nr:copper homeostasis protein CutC [Fibrisoma limi]CCH56319.1 CutC family protein [Fibrisoma limi BUZ 3]
MTVEVCAYSLASCLAAQRAGANRIELCGGMSEGGITPSAGLIRQVRQSVSLPIYVMIRPRGGDFLYTDTELAVMRSDIEAARQLGADGIVLGVLLADGTVDEAKTRELIELAHPLPVTFHRAFDMTVDPFEALEAIIRTGAERILTSGQQPKAEAGLPLLRQLVRQAAGRIEIMAGAGVSVRNAGLFHEAGLTAVHLSGSRSQPSPMTFRQPAVSMASSAPSEYERIEADETVIRSVVQTFV